MSVNNDIYSLVREAEENYTSGTVKLSKYVDWSMYDTIQIIDAYLNSVHISGSVDSLGREKPFFNIVTAATNIWYRATDIDRKDVRFASTCSEDDIFAFVVTIHLREWMTRERFGVFLNSWGRTLARYGSAVVKFVEQDGELKPSVVSWSRLIVDPIDFNARPVIEKIYKTPAQLLQSTEYNQKIVKELIESRMARQTLEGTDQDQMNEFIEIYEVHGELPLSYLTDKDKDDDVFRQQMHVITFTKDEKTGNYNDYELYRGKESKSPYLLTHLIEEEGRTLGIGAVEYLFDAQWMVNHTIKQQRDYLDLASKLIFQTADARFVGRNILNAVETGEILNHQPNMPLTQVSNNASNITALLSFGQQWVGMSREITSTPDSLRGNTMPSGTPYSLGAILQQQASSLFELMVESKGLAIEEMMRVFVIPHLKSKMDTSEEIAATLDSFDIKKIDARHVPREAVKRHNEKYINTVLSGGMASPYQQATSEAEVTKELSQSGNQRYFKPSDISTMSWKKLLKDFEWRIRVEVTNEPQDKQATLQTLSTVFQTIASNPMVLQDSNAQNLFAKILNTAGVVSPLELTTPTLPPNQPPQAPQVQGAVPTLAVNKQ